MAVTDTFVFNHAKEQLLDGDLDPSADNLSVTLLMSTSTAFNEFNVTTMTGIGTGFTTLGEHTHIAGDKNARRISLASVALGTTTGGISGYAFIDSTDPVFAAPGNDGGGTTVGCLLYKVVGGSVPEGVDTTNIPVAYYSLGSFTTGASTITIQWSATGFLQIN